MSHKLIDGKVVIDWTTGDPEGDRANVMSAYRDFIKEVKDIVDNEKIEEDVQWQLRDLFKKWNVSTKNQVDDFPRIWIKRPE